MRSENFLMIIGAEREKVIENIRMAAAAGQYHAKVELQDPILSAEEKAEIIDRYLTSRSHFLFRLKSGIARGTADILTAMINRETEIVYEKEITLPHSGFIITSNHFSPLENTVIRHFTNRIHRRLNIVSQVTNFAMDGGIGFLMNYADTIPLSDNYHYLSRRLLPLLQERLQASETVLIYPEQEMWFHYRKPRPPKEGAYYIGARLGTPILSCFVEIIDLEEKDTAQFKKVRYILHILDLLIPDPAKSVHENCTAMAAADYTLKRNAYEKIYHKPLTYAFDKSDIAGWVGESDAQ